MATNTRKINTNLFSDKAFEMLESVIGQLSDGIWENSNAMDKYWRFASIKRADNNQIIIEISKDEYLRETYDYRCRYLQNAFFKMSDAEVIQWFAGKLKQIVKIEMKNKPTLGAWKRDNDSKLSYFGYKQEIAVKDVYTIYDFLNGRSMTKYDNADELIGKPASDEDTQAAAKKRELLEHETAVYNSNYKEIADWEKAEIERIKKEASAKRSAIWAEYNKICKELK